jgi:hypothetical protein
MRTDHEKAESIWRIVISPTSQKPTMRAIVGPDCGKAGRIQWQPQVFGVQPQPPEPAVVEDSAEDLLPFAGAAKTESWIVCAPLAHLGQVMAVLLFITIRS